MQNYVAALRFISFFVLSFLLFPLLFSCSQKEQPDEQTIIKFREDYRNKIETAKDNIDKVISDLQAESEQAGDNEKKTINQQIDKLEDRRNDLNAKLDELGKTTREKWVDYKESVDKLLNNIDEDFRDVTKEVREERK